MPRYEMVEGTSSKFWEISLDGRSFTATWGRIGTDGQSKAQRFDDEATALKEYEKLIASKVKKGYRPVDGPPPKQPPGDRQQLVVRLEDGRRWRELTLEGLKLTQRSGWFTKPSEDDSPSEKYGTVKEAREMLDFLVSRYAKSGMKEVSRKEATIREADTPEAVASRITDNPELERACLDDPDNIDSWRVYADWLQTHGDPRGELAALHVAEKGSAALDYLKKNGEALFGELASHVGEGIYDLVQRHGFYVGASLRQPRSDAAIPLAELTRAFLKLPLTRFVSQLRFGLASYESNNDWTATLKSVLASTQAPQLRSIAFADYTYSDCEISWTPFGDLSAIWKGLPKLQLLHVRSGAGGELGKIEHSALKTFIRESGGLGADELDAIVNAKWPQLERLDVWTGSSDYEGEATLDMIRPLLAARGLPKLTHFGLVNSELTNGLVPALAASALLPQLRVLDLSKGVLTDTDAADFLLHQSAFEHLERLDLSENLIDGQIDALKAALPHAVIADQRDSEDRYVAVGE